MSVAAKIRDKVHRAWLARRSLAQLKARLALRRGVLGLCYHALSDGLDAYPYRTSPEAFEAQLMLLKETFEIVSVAGAVDILRGGAATSRDRPLAMICFDDGYRCNWTRATPALERQEVPATLFAARDLIRQPGPTYLSEDELVALAAHPLWDVGGHGISHNVLTGFLAEDCAREIGQSAEWLNGLLGHGPRGFAYPQGQISAPVIDKTREHFAYGLATDRRIGPAPDLHQIRRFCPTRDHDDLHVFAQALLSAPMEVL